MRPTPTVLVLAAALTLAACGGGNTGGSDGGTDGGNLRSLGLTANWTSIRTKLLPSCTLGNQCHGSAGGATPTGYVILDESAAYANIVGQPSTEQPSINLVEPGHPEASYLINKLDGSQADVCSANSQPSFNCGLQMPNGGPYLSPADIDAIRTWISAGAINN